PTVAGGPRDFDLAVRPGLQRQRHCRVAGHQRHRRPHAPEPGAATAGGTADRPGSGASTMSYLNQPPVPPRSSDRGPDDVDRLLRAYFRKELPARWPPFAEPSRDPRPSVPPGVNSGRLRDPARRVPGRLALAAAVVLCVCGYLALASNFPSRPDEPGVRLD